MTHCDTLADVRSAVFQIDQMLLSLLAERQRYEKEAARFAHGADQVTALVAPDAVEAARRALFAGGGTI